MPDFIILVVLFVALIGLGGYSGVYRAKTRQQITVLRVQLAQTEKKLADCEKPRAEPNLNHHDSALFATLVNTAYDALLVVDREYRIRACNHNAEEVFAQADLIGKSLVEEIGVAELSALIEAALLHETDVLEEQITIRGRNYSVKAQVVRENGLAWIGLALRDISLLVRLNRARRDMVANISHELRTPIANIQLIIDSLFLEDEKPKRKASISSLRAIARETENLLWLVQEMSDLAMIESGQAIVKLVDVPLGELVDEAIERLEDQSHARQITIKSHVPATLQVLCDRDLARRVLVNLLHNALKWSPRGEVITVNAETGNEEITISVLDNGPGVPEDQVERIFERFYQMDSSRSGTEGGTGLGLAICRHVVEVHGGKIWAESNKDGGGGKFRFTLLNAAANGTTTAQS